MPAEAPELVADEVQRCHEDDRDRLRDDLARVEMNEQPENGDVRSECDDRDEEKPQTLVGDMAALPPEVQ